MTNGRWQPETLIFDFDGTLADTPLDFLHMRREAVAAMRTVTEVPERCDLPVMELLAHTMSGLDTDTASRLRAVTDEAVRRVEIQAAANGKLYPGVRELFATCRDKGIATGIITRNCREAVLRVVPDLPQLCPCLLTRDDVVRIKPHPEHLIRALEKLGAAAETSLMVGDHPMDIQVGKAAGCRTAAVATGDTSVQRLAREEPDYLLPDVMRLAADLGLVPLGR